MSFLFIPILMTFSSSVIASLPLALSFQLSSASAALHSVRSTLLPSVLASSGISLTSSSLSYASVVACFKLRAVGSLSLLAKHSCGRHPGGSDGAESDESAVPLDGLPAHFTGVVTYGA